MGKIIKVRPYDVSNGEGIRTSIFFSGCDFFCKNCFNQSAWDFNIGVPCGEWLIEEISQSMNENVSGIAILGGEPMHDKNVEDLYKFVKAYRQKYTNKTIWLYSGFTYEELVQSYVKKSVLKYIDVLVDGRYVDELRNLKLAFRGSSNQRIIDVKKSLEKSEVVLWNKKL